MKDSTTLFLHNQIEEKSYQLLSESKEITQKQYATALKRAVTTYGKQDGFLNKIKNIWVRFSNCIKAIFGYSDWQIASSFLRAEQKSKHAHSRDILKEVVGVIKASKVITEIPDYEQYLFEGISDAHKLYVKVYTCNDQKISDMQLKTLVEASYIDPKENEKLNEKYSEIVHKTFDKAANTIATKIGKRVINRLPNRIHNRTKLHLFSKIYAAAVPALIDAFDPLSI